MSIRGRPKQINSFCWVLPITLILSGGNSLAAADTSDDFYSSIGARPISSTANPSDTDTEGGYCEKCHEPPIADDGGKLLRRVQGVAKAIGGLFLNNTLSCAQKAPLKAAKRVAPHRSFSIGTCGPGVQRIIASAERAIPGFDNPPVPTSGRYPPNFIGWLRNRGWDQLDGIHNEKDAPPGTVIIFRGPGKFKDYHKQPGAGYWVGHITIKGDDGLWYTDGRTPHAHIPNRFFLAAFKPGPKQEAACEKQGGGS